jgi:hypothetical protein
MKTAIDAAQWMHMDAKRKPPNRISGRGLQCISLLTLHLQWSGRLDLSACRSVAPLPLACFDRLLVRFKAQQLFVRCRSTSEELFVAEVRQKSRPWSMPGGSSFQQSRSNHKDGHFLSMACTDRHA